MTGFTAKPHRARTPDDNDWRYYAACLGHDSDVFFPNPDNKKLSSRDKLKIAEAAGLCAVCPVTAECAASRGNACGVWAGEMHKLTLITMPSLPSRHGDEAGYQAHKRANEEPCEACLKGMSIARAARKKAKRQAEDRSSPSELFDVDAAITRVKALLDRMYS